MTDRELKRMSRAGLLELLSEQSRELDRLREENERLSESLRDREILLRESGSIAEAALKLNGVFEAAQSAADQYLSSVRHIYDRLPETDSEG
ncbi:MAG: DNA repair protein [Ruminococcus sp.]|nr:DNA repair protein [Ruminococcus sp.]